MNKVLFLIFSMLVAVQARGEIIQLSVMGPVVKENEWAWVRMGLKLGDHLTPVEYEWRDGSVTMETVCRNANENLSLNDCLKAAKAIFGYRCRALKEIPYCEAEAKVIVYQN